MRIGRRWRHQPAVVTVEVVWVIWIVLKDERLLFNNSMALLADILAEAPSLLPIMARATQVPEGNVWGGELKITGLPNNFY